jgi:hypothetical protein
MVRYMSLEEIANRLQLSGTAKAVERLLHSRKAFGTSGAHVRSLLSI